MNPERLRILYLSRLPPSPPSFGAQRRIHGLMSALAGHHDITCVTLVSPDVDRAHVEQAMGRYCQQMVLIPFPRWQGIARRVAQVRSLASEQSFERRFFDRRALRHALRGLLRAQPFDIVDVEFPFLAHYPFDQVPPGSRRPLRVLGEHNIEFDLARQQMSEEHGFLRRVHNAANWPKLQREETQAFRTFDGVTFCSEADERRARALVPSLRSAVVPNAVDVEDFRPATHLPSSDGRTVMFFGALNYFPNVDGVFYLVREIWPLVERSHPRARLKIVGPFANPEILALQGPRIEVTGKVDDLRPHLASAAVTVVPLRIGGGTRFKILEAMAMARPVVSTSLGAEGIDAQAGVDLLIADEPPAFARAVGRALDDQALAAQLGSSGRALVEARYTWKASAHRLEWFFQELVESQRGRASIPAARASSLPASEKETRCWETARRPS
jgi:glycosyltransferase involved in cell wall biosynthesis